MSDEKTLDRVRKLIALAESPNEHDAFDVGTRGPRSSGCQAGCGRDVPGNSPSRFCVVCALGREAARRATS